ncbi:MAG: GPW/gp25 family protein [Planctomycetes bacterium]|nr:GPW/gp25 family protein [Planctomycetota bacterium]
MPNKFLGTGWAFPVAVDARGGIRMRSAEDDVKEACRIILGTRLAERVMRPQFGSGLENFVFDRNDANLAGRIEFFVRRALELWEPRVEVQEVKATPEGNRIDIDVRYVVLATNREDNLVFPFFVGDLP